MGKCVNIYKNTHFRCLNICIPENALRYIIKNKAAIGILLDGVTEKMGAIMEVKVICANMEHIHL